MAPESMAKSIFTEKSDIYSLGILAFEILSESPAYGDLVGFDLINNVVTKRQRPIMEKLKIQFQPEIVQLIEDCLEHEPEYRPTASQICKAMINILKKTS
jgi:serine/threonine protein kinase